MSMKRAPMRTRSPLLPSPCSHYSSFLRSLCYYDFHRVRGDVESCEYIHDLFHRDHPENLSKVSTIFCPLSMTSAPRAAASAWA